MAGYQDCGVEEADSSASLRNDNNKGNGGGLRPMIVAGVMSGTSADGVDVAVCRIAAGADGEPKVRVLGHEGFRYPRAVREAVLRAMDAEAISVAEMSKLSWRLGQIYGACVERACAGLGVEMGAGLAEAVALPRDTPPFAMKRGRVGVEEADSSALLRNDNNLRNDNICGMTTMCG